jgi:type II pantothenate kinase
MGGYNNNFLELVAFLLNVKIYIIHGYMETILSAISYLNTHSNDCFYSLPNKQFKNIYELGNLKSDPKEQIYFSIKEDLYPYLLVNLRSGASFLRVDSPTKFKRIIGTSIGAGTFVGISKLLWEGNDLTTALFAGLKGDSRNIDMSVGDIYGK